MVETERMLSLTEIMEILDVSRFTIYRYIKENQLPAYKIGGAWKFSQRDFDKFLSDRKVRGEMLS